MRSGSQHRVLVVSLLLLGAGFSCDTPATKTAHDADDWRQRTLVIGSTADIAGINPLVSGHTRLSQDVIDLMFLHLVEEQPDFAEGPPTFAPELALDWEWSEDRLRLTFHLDPDARWSDGAPITADDVRWTWLAQTDPDLAWSYSDSKDRIRDVEILNPQAVRFHFTTTYASQMLDANTGVILPRHAWSQVPFSRWREMNEWFAQNLVVNGPYLLNRWDPQSEIALERNPEWTESNERSFQRVLFRIIPDKLQQLSQLRTGLIDFVQQIPAQYAESIQESSDLELLSFWHRQYDYLCWNTERELFRDPRVRQALTMAIDRQTIIDTVLLGYATVGTSPIISSVWAHDPGLRPWPYDPKEATSTLGTLGWSDSDEDGILDRQGVPLSFELAVNSGNSSRVDAAVMIQAQMKKIGIDVRVRPLEFNTLVGLEDSRDFDATLGAWGIDTSLDLRYAFHSESIENGYNFSGYSNPEIDALIDSAASLVNADQRREALARIQEILHRDQPYTFLWEPKRFDAANRRIVGAIPNPLTSFFRLETWTFREAG